MVPVGRGLYRLMIFDNSIEVIEKVIAVVWIILPGVLAIEYDAHHRRFIKLRPTADIFQGMHEMLGGVPPKPLRILEANHIRKPLIPEKTDETICFVRDLVCPIEIMVSLGQWLSRIGLVQAVDQNSFPTTRPLAVLLGNKLQECRRYSPFSRPNTTRGCAKASRMTFYCRA